MTKYMTIKRRMTLEVSHDFTNEDASTARMAARERDCSVNKVLRERLRASVAQTLISAGYKITNA